jgi:hypothetical protein
MRAAYKFLAYAIDALILLQAAMIAWAVFGLSTWIEDDNQLTKSVMEGDTFVFTEERGFMVHGISGMMLIPLIGLVLLIVSFFARIPEGTKWAGMLFVGILVQVALGIFGHSVSAAGALHGAWALLLFWLAYRTARQSDVHEVAPAAYESSTVR